jgi:hypothetical protein
MDTTRSAVATFTHPLVADASDLDGTTTAIRTELCYDSSDPYAATVRFRTEQGDVVWTFARDLLLGGLVEPTGDGDVHVWPCMDDAGRDVIVLELCSPVGDALVFLPPEAVASFTDRMLATVPAGEESAHIDLDAVVAALLSSDGV